MKVLAVLAFVPLSAAMRKGTLRRNSRGFTDDQCEALIGLGLSAISAFSMLIAQNEKNNRRIVSDRA